MTTLELVLGAAVVVLAVAVVLLLRGAGGPDRAQVQSAVSGALADLGIEGTAARIETHASELKAVHADIEAMLSTPQQRGAFGERQLEAILADGLPPDMYDLQASIDGGARPDATVRTPEGRIAIDAKFPLDNFERAVEAEDGSEAEARFERRFADDVRRQLEKIATDYVDPEAGTAEFAFAYIPSERVYYHLISEEFDLLREFTGRGVQVVSPLTIGHKLELIKAGVQAERLSETAEAVRAELRALSGRFEDFEETWSTFRHHFDNAADRAADADREFDRLRSTFEAVSDPALDVDEVED